MRATLIHNPTAGDEVPTADDLERMLAEVGFQVRYQSSKKNWKKALARSADLVVVAGGDGTVAKVFSELAESSVPVAVLPVGTANNIARTIGVVGDASEIVAGWPSLETRRFDLGRVKTGGAEHLFVESAGGGLFARAIAAGADVELATGLVGHEIDRSLAHLRRVVAQAPARRWSVTLDGVDVSGEYIAVEAMNIRHVGPNVPLAPAADPGDGQLDLVVVREADRASLVGYLDERLTQHQVTPPRFEVRTGHEVVLRRPSDALHVDDASFDGGRASWRICVPGAAVNVVWPAGRL